MADDEEKVRKHTLQTLFPLYEANIVIESKRKRRKRRRRASIVNKVALSQIDFWLKQAGLLPKIFSLTDTGLLYMRYKKWRLIYEEFLEFLETLCQLKGVPLETVHTALVEAGTPGLGETIIIAPK